MTHQLDFIGSKLPDIGMIYEADSLIEDKLFTIIPNEQAISDDESFELKINTPIIYPIYFTESEIKICNRFISSIPTFYFNWADAKENATIINLLFLSIVESK